MSFLYIYKNFFFPFKRIIICKTIGKTQYDFHQKA